MVTETYIAAELFFVPIPKTGWSFFKLKLIRTDFLEHETLTRFPTKMYTEVSSQIWLNSVEYLPKHSRIARVGDAQFIDMGKKPWKGWSA